VEPGLSPCVHLEKHTNSTNNTPIVIQNKQNEPFPAFPPSLRLNEPQTKLTSLIPPERLQEIKKKFSHAGLTCSALKNRYSVEMLAIMVFLKKNVNFMPSVEEVVFEMKRMKQAAKDAKRAAAKAAKAACSSSSSSCAGASGGGGADADVAEDVENDDTDDEEDLPDLTLHPPCQWRRGEPPDLHRRLPL
jgi:hypothetical protein